MFSALKKLFPARDREAELDQHLQELRQRLPVPLFWLFGKTQSGKTSVVKYLTGADQAEIGQGFRPCTRHSRLYEFPTAEAPLLTFLDTRGLEEVGYDPAEDLARFNEQAHVVLVTVKLMDHAQERILQHLRTLRQARPERPVLLVLTCLHEAYPQQQHPQPYPYGEPGDAARIPEAVQRNLQAQRQRFEGLVDQVVAVDLTPPEEGFTDPVYGGSVLKQTLVEMLPAAYRQTLLALDEGMKGLQDLYARRAQPYIVGYTTLAGTAGAMPIPWLDLLILPGIQTRMIYHIAELYGQPLTPTRYAEIVSTLGAGILFRQATRELLKFIPYVGSVAGGVLAAASTYALGKAFCYYYSAVHKGHVPQSDELRRYYREQLEQARKHWHQMGTPPPGEPHS